MSKNLRFILGISLILACVAGILFYSLSIPTKEITRARLQQLIDADSIVAAKVSPTAYEKIYSVEGTESSGKGISKFKITTRLDEAQTTALLEKSAVKIEIPGKGATALLINI